MSDFMSVVVTVAAFWVWWKYIKHHHSWTAWTDWVLTKQGTFGRTAFFRERYCATCPKQERQSIGEHECQDRPDCTHRDIFVAAFDKNVAISNKERELGL